MRWLAPLNYVYQNIWLAPECWSAFVVLARSGTVGDSMRVALACPFWGIFILLARFSNKVVSLFVARCQGLVLSTIMARYEYLGDSPGLAI